MADDGFRHVEPQLKFVIPLRRKTIQDTTAVPAVSSNSSSQHKIRKFSDSSARPHVLECSDSSLRQNDNNGNIAGSVIRNSKEYWRRSQRSVHFHPASSGTDSEDEKDVLSSAIFHNVKRQLEYSISDPLKRKADGGFRRATGSLRNVTGSLRCASGKFQRSPQRASIPTGKIVHKVNEISAKLTFPKFFTEQLDSFTNATANDEAHASSSDESDDPEFRELEERSQIVEKYERGPEQEVEEWENPDLELYKVTDRYGFMHKDTQELSAQELVERKRMAKEVSREQKWLRMISRWTDGKGTSEKLRRRIWKGVPEKLRSLVWARLLEISRYQQQQQKGNIYRELLMRARLISKDIKQIDLDINRTYRDHWAFRRRYDVKQQSLFNVLAAYAMYNTEVGYCQGMSQIAALFLMYMDEEEAFWCLHALLVDKKHSMHGFFVPGFPKLVRFQTHYEKILQKYLPRLKKHLDKAGIPPIYVTKWWFGCFLDRVPFPLALRIWDVFLLEGDVILTAMAYNIMKMHEKTIRKLQMENFMEFIQTVIAQDFGFSDEETMKSLQDCLRKLHNDRMLLPAPPKPGDMPETPTKSFGPVLSRSMIDIRLDIAEIQSRCSRANSVAGRSPAVLRRPRLPPSPTPVSKYMPAQLPPRRTEPMVMENSHSSLSSTSTLKDISLREQPQPAKGISDGTKLSSPLRESRENSCAMEPQHHPVSSATTVPTTRIQMKTTRPLLVEEVRCDIRMDGRDSSYRVPSPQHSAINNAEFEAREEQLQQQQQRNQRPTTLFSGQQMRSVIASPDRPWSKGMVTATRHFGTALQQETIRPQQFPPEEPPIDYDNSAYYTRSARSPTSVRSITPKVSPSQVSSTSMGSSLYDSHIFSSSRRKQIFDSDRIPAASSASTSPTQKFDFGTTSKFRSEFPNDEIPQPLIQRTQRGSFYDNVPSPTPVTTNSREQLKDSVGEQRHISKGVVYSARADDGSLEKRSRSVADRPSFLETRRERRTVETRVVQLPNNVTCVRVGDNLEGMPPPRQQFYDIPVRRIASGNGTHPDSTAESRRHQQHFSGTSSGTTGHTRRYEAHFPTEPSQLEAVQYERDAYRTSDRRPPERRPLRVRPDQHHLYSDKF